VAIGATILQNQLKHRLPEAFLKTFDAQRDIAYTAIPTIPSLPLPLRDEVRGAFAASLTVLWKVAVVICGVGLLSALLQKDIPLHQKKDERWGLERHSGENVLRVNLEATSNDSLASSLPSNDDKF
jgi:hypothetical protein